MTDQARAMSELHWTTEKPTKPGWYWWRMKRFADSKIYRVEKDPPHVGRGLYVSPIGYVDFIDGQWAGPLEPPEEVPK